MRRILPIILLLFSLGLQAQSDTSFVEDLRYRWVTIQNEQIHPVINVTDLNLVMFTLTQSDFDLLSICNNELYDVWVNARLIQEQEQGCSEMNLKEVSRMLGADSLVVQVLSKYSLLSLSTDGYTLDEQKDERKLTFLLRDQLTFRSFFAALLTLILLVSALLRRFFPAHFKSIFRNIISGKAEIEQLFIDFFETENLLFGFYLVILSSVVWYFSRFHLQVASHFTFAEMTLIWLQYVLAISIFLLVKYVFARLASAIFDFKNLHNYQINDFVTYFIFISIIMLLVSICAFVADFQLTILPLEIFKWIVLISYLIFQIRIFFRLSDWLGVNKILIISYLCIAEFISAFTVVYILIKR